MVSFDSKIVANSIGKISGVPTVGYSTTRTPGDPFKTPASDVKSDFFHFSDEIRSKSGIDLERQNGLFHFNRLDTDLKDALVYEGRPISALSPQEASDLIKEDGFFGAAKTSERIAGFVLTGAGDDLERLKAGRQGVLKGFEEAEKLWGEKLPSLSYETLEKSLEAIDQRINELGGSVVDLTA